MEFLGPYGDINVDYVTRDFGGGGYMIYTGAKRDGDCGSGGCDSCS